MSDRLFIYGTLAPGQRNHYVLEDVQGTWEKASLRGYLHERGWGAAHDCPGIVLSDEAEPVAGHLFTSEQLADLWPMLDAFEGDEYKRTPVTVKTDDGKQVSAQVYALASA